MKTFSTVILFLVTLFIFAGCIIQDDTLDYRNNLSDHEVKKIVREVLISQNSIGHAGLITSDGLDNLLQNRNRYLHERYECSDGGYASLTFGDDTFSFTITTGTLFELEYSNCYETPLYYDRSGIDGSIEIIYHQNSEDYHTKLLDFSVHYLRTYLYTRLGEIYIDGEVGVHYDEDYDRHQLSVILSSSNLRIEERNTYENTIFNNIVLDFQIDTYSYIYNYNYSGTLYNSYLGTLSFTTIVPMRGYREKNPYSGRFKISNNHMSLTVIPQDDYYVDILVENHYYNNRNRVIHTTWINIGL